MCITICVACAASDVLRLCFRLPSLGEHLRLRHTTFKPIVDVVVGGDVSLFVIVAVAMLLVWAHVICVGKISKRCMHCGL